MKSNEGNLKRKKIYCNFKFRSCVDFGRILDSFAKAVKCMNLRLKLFGYNLKKILHKFILKLIQSFSSESLSFLFKENRHKRKKKTRQNE